MNFNIQTYLNMLQEIDRLHSSSDPERARSEKDAVIALFLSGVFESAGKELILAWKGPSYKIPFFPEEEEATFFIVPSL